jgi:hypothetical protein
MTHRRPRPMLEWIRPLLVMVLTIPTVIYLGIRLRAHTGAVAATG